MSLIGYPLLQCATRHSFEKSAVWEIFHRVYILNIKFTSLQCGHVLYTFVSGLCSAQHISFRPTSRPVPFAFCFLLFAVLYCTVLNRVKMYQYSCCKSTNDDIKILYFVHAGPGNLQKLTVPYSSVLQYYSGNKKNQYANRNYPLRKPIYSTAHDACQNEFTFSALQSSFAVFLFNRQQLSQVTTKPSQKFKKLV